MAYNIYAEIIANSSNNDAWLDKKDFNDYYEGKIEIEECLNKFLERYSKQKLTTLLDLYIDTRSFKEWIESLGYRRYEVWKEK